LIGSHYFSQPSTYIRKQYYSRRLWDQVHNLDLVSCCIIFRELPMRTELWANPHKFY
jgi:hypothetical protein